MAAERAAAQAQFGGIEGVVKDESGGMLPGVAVEVRSPALIEGVRVTVTDGDGSCRALRLPVGEYTLRCSLTGFTMVERDKVIINS